MSIFFSLKAIVHSGALQLSDHQAADGGRTLFRPRLPPSSTNPCTEALDTDPLPTDLPLGLPRVSDWMVASRARHIPVLNLDGKSYGDTQARGPGVTSAVLMALFDYELQLFDTSFLLITYSRCRTETTATV